jgi:hypothetical protein
VIAAAMRPSQRPYQRRPSANIAGIVAMPNSADGRRMATSEVPNACLQTYMIIQ